MFQTKLEKLNGDGLKFEKIPTLSLSLSLSCLELCKKLPYGWKFSHCWMAFGWQQVQWS
jgi:hypothetical protein